MNWSGIRTFLRPLGAAVLMAGVILPGGPVAGVGALLAPLAFVSARKRALLRSEVDEGEPGDSADSEGEEEL